MYFVYCIICLVLKSLVLKNTPKFEWVWWILLCWFCWLLDWKHLAEYFGSGDRLSVTRHVTPMNLTWLSLADKAVHCWYSHPPSAIHSIYTMSIGSCQYLYIESFALSFNPYNIYPCWYCVNLYNTNCQCQFSSFDPGLRFSFEPLIKVKNTLIWFLQHELCCSWMVLVAY